MELFLAELPRRLMVIAGAGIVGGFGGVVAPFTAGFLTLVISLAAVVGIAAYAATREWQIIGQRWSTALVTTLTLTVGVAGIMIGVYFALGHFATLD